MQQKLAQAEADSKRLQSVELPGLLSEKERAQRIIDGLQVELQTQRLERAAEHQQLTAQLASATEELQKLSADNAVLRSELAKTVHQKQTTTAKLEQIRKKLGLTESEAKAFIQELDDARATSKALREENKELAADNAHLKGQVESRSQHCMTLIGENKRLLEQVAELRMQLQKQQGELWQAKTERQTATAAVRQLQQASSKKGTQLVVREIDTQPQAGSASSVSAAPAPSSAGGRRASGSQNRPPWSEAGSGKGTSSGGGAAAKAAQVPLGAAPLPGTDVAKAGVVRQALAVRQQRLASAKKPS